MFGYVLLCRYERSGRTQFCMWRGVSSPHLKKKKLTLPKQNKKPLMDFNSCRNRHAPYADVYPKQSLLQTCIHIHLRTDGLG